MKKILFILLLILIGGVNASAQKIEQRGTNFVVVSEPHNNNQKDTGVQKTSYTYTDSKGQVHEIFLSSRGKAFYYYIAKDGKRKKRYVPEIGRKINPQAYDN